MPNSSDWKSRWMCWNKESGKRAESSPLNGVTSFSQIRLCQESVCRIRKSCHKLWWFISIRGYIERWSLFLFTLQKVNYWSMESSQAWCWCFSDSCTHSLIGIGDSWGYVCVCQAGISMQTQSNKTTLADSRANLASCKQISVIKYPLTPPTTPQRSGQRLLGGVHWIEQY